MNCTAMRSDTQQLTESRIRRQAKKMGFAVRKSRKQKFDFNNQCKYALLHAKTNFVIAGVRFQLPLEVISEILNEYEATTCKPILLYE